MYLNTVQRYTIENPSLCFPFQILVSIYMFPKRLEIPFPSKDTPSFKEFPNKFGTIKVTTRLNYL